MNQAERMESTIYWYRPSQREPVRTQTILVKYDGQIWPAVYAGDHVSLYPADFGKIKLSDCTWWAALPRPPADSRAETLT